MSFLIEDPSSSRYPDIIFRVERKRGTQRGKDFRLLKKNSEKFMYTLSADASHPLLIQQAVACARSSSWKGSSRCKAENPRYKCQVRLSAFHLLLPPPSSLLSRILHPTRLSSPREKLSLLLSLDVTISPPLSYSFPLYPHPTLVLNFQISFCLSTTPSCLPSSSCCRLEISTPLGLFRAYLYPFPSFQSPPLSLCCPSLPLTSLPSFFRTLPISHQCETTNEVQEE